MVEGAVVKATDRDTGQVDGEARTDTTGSYAIQGLPGDRYAVEVTPPSGYLSVAPEYVTRPPSGDLELNVDFSLPFHTPTEGTVTTVPAGELVRMSSNFFDLEATTLTFSPEHRRRIQRDGRRSDLGRDRCWGGRDAQPGTALE